MTDRLAEVERSFREALERACDLESLEKLRVGVLGKKGALTALLRSVGELPAGERPRFGEKVNRLREELEGTLVRKKAELQAERESQSVRERTIDVTLPGRRPEAGSLHPLSLVERRIVRIFRSIGFSIVEGPEVETDYYNFEALNFPAEHPARDMQDTLFVEGGLLLRTHTSPVQIRTMELRPPPLSVIVPGRAYRHDSDMTHSPAFHQIEGLCVGPQITFAHLKGTLETFVRRMFGAGVGTRFRPSYFPFTEPSAEVDMACAACSGRGCRVCKGSGWLEILGCGMVHPSVYEFAGRAWKARGQPDPYDPEKIGGFAFGLGVERAAMVLYGVDDIRLFFENDVRFLEQFGEWA